MRPRDIVELLLLAAIWGASFMFMRMAVPSFGPIPVAGLRVAGAAAMLLPIALMHGEWGTLRRHAGAISVVGIVGSAMPFVLYAVAALATNAGVMSILNASTPLWGALIMWAWMSERLGALRIVGLLLGAAGVAWLAWDHASMKHEAATIGPITAIAACLAAALCYAFVAVFAKKRLAGVAPIAVAAGSQLAGTLALALPMWWFWPSADAIGSLESPAGAITGSVPSAGTAISSAMTGAPGIAAWASVAALALLCTGVAYLLYFRLIAHIGATSATTVTFLIPLFAVLWGTLLLGEAITTPMVVAGALILLGTGLSTGLLARRATSSNGTSTVSAPTTEQRDRDS